MTAIISGDYDRNLCSGGFSFRSLRGYIASYSGLSRKRHELCATNWCPWSTKLFCWRDSLACLYFGLFYSCPQGCAFFVFHCALNRSVRRLMFQKLESTQFFNRCMPVLVAKCFMLLRRIPSSNTKMKVSHVWSHFEFQNGPKFYSGTQVNSTLFQFAEMMCVQFIISVHLHYYTDLLVVNMKKWEDSEVAGNHVKGHFTDLFEASLLAKFDNI